MPNVQLGQHALRTEASNRRSSLRAVDLDESPGAKPVSEQLVAILRQQAVRIIDLFRECAAQFPDTMLRNSLTPSILQQVGRRHRRPDHA